MPKADDIDNIPQGDIPQDDIPRNVVPVTTVQLDLRLARDTLETLQDAAAIQGLTFVQLVERLLDDWAQKLIEHQGVLQLTLNDQLAIARAILSGEIEAPSPYVKRVIAEYRRCVESV